MVFYYILYALIGERLFKGDLNKLCYSISTVLYLIREFHYILLISKIILVVKIVIVLNLICVDCLILTLIMD